MRRSLRIMSGIAIALIGVGIMFSANAQELDPAYRQYTRLLQKHVANGMVDYRALKADSQALDQYLDTVAAEAPTHIRDFDFEKLARREIVVRSHCFACTAGAGSTDGAKMTGS